MGKMFDFTPFPLIRGAHGQTIFGTLFCFERTPQAKTELVELPDGDKIACEVSTPLKWTPFDQTVIMLHGLCGSHESGYLLRMTRKLTKAGIRAVRMNMRGCGSGRGHAKQVYHSGRSDDVYQVIKYFKEQDPHSEISLIGFSLGGNVVLKLAGELNVHGCSLLKQVIAVCPPINLHKTVLRLDTKVNRFYRNYFLKALRAGIVDRHKRFTDLPPLDLPEDVTFYEFDELYIARESGFKSAVDYYTKCSSGQMIPYIMVPTKILFAEDDPIVDSRDVLDSELPEAVEVYGTKNGGHMGFLGSLLHQGGFHWMDYILMKWTSGSE
ncbi:MAG: hypothetical protein SP1CHLAM54_07430 [Chlamydiia bacterium]|nr:hypothetical protein [Chlamydiia bacterium]MCH9615649.1 hypothetical protein [Chlamydiia bacterium]MCH9628948.1 hypothetical protein [Chlamydiia bacterium]